MNGNLPVCGFILETASGSQVLAGPGEFACPFIGRLDWQMGPITLPQMREDVQRVVSFVGDLDGDRRLDLWLTPLRDGGLAQGVLYLSSLASQYDLVGEAARFEEEYHFDPC